jgi:hypothetical protein
VRGTRCQDRGDGSPGPTALAARRSQTSGFAPNDAWICDGRAFAAPALWEPAPVRLRPRVVSEMVRRLPLRALGVLLILLSTASTESNGTGEGAAASCVGPYLNDWPPSGPFRAPTPTVAPGEGLTVYGHWYTNTCNDTGGDEPLVPLEPVHLTLTLPDGSVTELGEFEPHGNDMGFSTTVTVPPGTRSGVATVSDDRNLPATYEFNVSQ